MPRIWRQFAPCIVLGMLALQLTTASGLRLVPILRQSASGRVAVGWDTDPGSTADLGDACSLVQMGAHGSAAMASKVPNDLTMDFGLQDQLGALKNNSSILTPDAKQVMTWPLAVTLQASSDIAEPMPEETALGEGILVADRAWSTVAHAGQAKHITGLSLLAMMAFVLRSKQKQLRNRCQDALAESLAEASAEPIMEAPMEAFPEPAVVHGGPMEMLELPPPMRRLRNIGASYVIPRARVARCTNDFLSFDVPTLPCVWPLRALLSRPTPKGPWAKLQLTVDIIAASGLPPLLTCTPVDTLAPPEECGGTGGTGTPTCDGLLSAAGISLDAASGSGGGTELAALEDLEGSDLCPWLSICNAGETVVATILRRQDGSCLVQRQGQSTLQMAVHLAGDAPPSINISKQGHEISQATVLGCGRQEYLQVDTQPDVESPESCVLLMCTLAVLAFEP